MKIKSIVIFLVIINVLTNTLSISQSADALGIIEVHGIDTTNTTFPDSSIFVDSSKVKPKVIANTFIVSIGLDDSSDYISRVNRFSFSTEDYRNFSDILTYMPFFFLQDLGSLGQPNEQMVYGLGFGNISFLHNGVLLNNRLKNSYDLNKLGSGLVDSIEVAPITKGFLYSVYNNPLSIAFYSRNKFPIQPITQLKYFQASYDEAMVDVLFNIPITNKLSFGINISNTTIDSRFENSDYESWKVGAQINYQINDKVNITANYFFSYDTLALFGGLDTNIMLDDDFSTVLYESSSSVSSRYQLTYNNYANIKVLAKLIPNLKTDLTFYFNSTSQKFLQNANSSFNDIPSIIHGNYFQTIGLSLRNIYTQNIFSIDITANIENSSFNTDVLYQNLDESIYSISGEFKLPILNNKYFVPSVFGKANNFNSETLIGYGGEITGSLSSRASYYVGYSNFQQQASALERNFSPWFTEPKASPSDNTAFEIGLKLDYESIFGKFSYFQFASNNHLFPEIIQNPNDSLLINEVSSFNTRDISNSGFNLNFNFVLWKFLFSNNLSYYLSSRDERVYASPDYSIAGKIYYRDILFNNNLKLKTGISYRFTGGQQSFVYDFEKSLQITKTPTSLISFSPIPASIQVDLLLAGTIQDRATIFVTMENVLDSEYYVIPYYFKQSRTLRFGVSWLLFD